MSLEVRAVRLEATLGGIETVQYKEFKTTVHAEQMQSNTRGLLMKGRIVVRPFVRFVAVASLV
jgi:hypothetical protein